MNNGENFNIENKFVNYDSNNKEKKKSKKFIIIILLILLLGIAGYLFYVNKVEKESNEKNNDNYEEYDPNYKIEESNSNITSNITSNTTSNIESNISSNITSNIESNITSNIISNVTSNVVKSNSNKTSNTQSKVSVNDVKLSSTKLTMTVGDTKSISATVTPSNATNQAVTWSSSNSSIVSVDQTGKITGVGVGTATITAKTKDGNKTASATITVSAPAVSSISMSASTSTIYVGNYLYPTITYNPSDATGKSVTWSSSDTSIATVRVDGRVTGISEGNVTIKATTPNGKTTSKLFYIRENPVNFEIVWAPLSPICNKDGCYPTAYQPLVYKRGNQYSFKSIYYNGKTYYPYSTPSPSEINKSITTARVTTPKGNYLYSVKVTYK